jgi:hypothetical protein
MIKGILDLPAGAGETMTWSSEDEAEEKHKLAERKDRHWHSKAVAEAESQAALAAIANGPQKIPIEKDAAEPQVAPAKSET